MKRFLLFMARVVGTLMLLALAGSVLWNTYTNFVGGDYARAASFSSTFFVGAVWPLLVVTGAGAGVYFIWKKQGAEQQ